VGTVGLPGFKGAPLPRTVRPCGLETGRRALHFSRSLGNCIELLSEFLISRCTAETVSQPGAELGTECRTSPQVPFLPSPRHGFRPTYS